MPMTKRRRKAVIIGGCAGAKVAYEIFAANHYEILGFINNYVKPSDWSGIHAPLLGEVDSARNRELLARPDVDYFIATGDNRMRQGLTRDLIERTGRRPANAIHPSAIISGYAHIGTGNLICARATIGIGARIGDGTIINTGAIVEHDCRIDDYAQISPNAALAGYVDVSARAFVGTGANVIPHTRVGADCVVAAGAVVIHEVPAGILVAGCPAVAKKTVFFA